MEKLSSTARVLNRIIRVFRGLCLGFGIASAVLLVIALLLPDHLYPHLVDFSDPTLTLGTLTLELTKPLATTGSVRLPVCAVLAAALVTLGISAYGFHLLHKILLPMTQARPFDATVSGNLRKLGWVSLVGVLAFYALDALTAALEVFLFDLTPLFRPDMVTGYQVQSTLSLPLLLIPALLFLLSYVFRYGEELQKQSDETL